MLWRKTLKGLIEFLFWIISTGPILAFCSYALQIIKQNYTVLQVGKWQSRKGSQHMAGQVLKKEFHGRLVVQMGQDMVIHHAKN